jgi:hypothetical protein
MKNKSIENLTGFLIVSDTCVYFRVYDKEDTSVYKDYKINHPDLMVTIVDADAALFPTDDKHFYGVIDTLSIASVHHEI